MRILLTGFGVANGGHFCLQPGVLCFATRFGGSGCAQRFHAPALVARAGGPLARSQLAQLASGLASGRGQQALALLLAQRQQGVADAAIGGGTLN
jgi:hypothetical protein